jgi:hypothetical protein
MHGYVRPAGVSDVGLNRLPTPGIEGVLDAA